jgi:methionyl-tRNA synthetase
MQKKEKILITSALPYANGPLHFGHIAGAYLPGDCYARFKRLQGCDVHYICGSDEYGVAITLSAERAGRSPKEHVDIFHQINKDFFQKLNLSFDHYSRTTWEGHKDMVVPFFLDLLKNGFIEEKVTEQLYSVKDGRFLADRYVVGTCPNCGYESARGDECQKCGFAYEATDLKNPRSVLTGSSLERRPTKHWFLLLEKFRQPLLDWLAQKDWRPNVKNFVRKFIEDLHARAITRDSDWGIPVPLPGAEGKVLYVWFDAPIGYISASRDWAIRQGNPDAWKEYWMDPNCKLVNFIGKDNIPFHAAIFPAMVMGQNQPIKLVDELPANEFYNLEGRQFSKSDGWYIDLDGFFQNYTADQIRYAIGSNAPETSDSEFTWEGFQSACNSDLLGKYGNLINRTLVFAMKNCNGVVPSPKLDLLDQQFLDQIRQLIDRGGIEYDGFSLRKPAKTVMELAQLGNVYFNSKEPWRDAKETGDEEKMDRMKTTIYCCIQCIKALALISSPLIPTTAQKVWAMIGMNGDLSQQNWDQVRDLQVVPGQKFNEPEILFRKVEDDGIKHEKEKLQLLSDKSKAAKEREEAQRAVEFSPLKEAVSIDDFQQLDLRVGIVNAAEKVVKSKKLLKLTVDLGFESRTILSGISEHYEPGDLIGKKVIVVANLKPATIMGIESQGMILAGSLGKDLELVGIGALSPGAVVK